MKLLCKSNFDMDSYDTVIIGFPIWRGLAPRFIETFKKEAK